MEQRGLATPCWSYMRQHGRRNTGRGPRRHSRTDEAGLTGRRATGRTSVRRRSVRREGSWGGCLMLATGAHGAPGVGLSGFVLTNFWGMTLSRRSAMRRKLRAERWRPRSVLGRAQSTSRFAMEFGLAQILLYGRQTRARMAGLRYERPGGAGRETGD